MYAPGRYLASIGDSRYHGLWLLTQVPRGLSRPDCKANELKTTGHSLSLRTLCVHVYIHIYIWSEHIYICIDTPFRYTSTPTLAAQSGDKVAENSSYSSVGSSWVHVAIWYIPGPQRGSYIPSWGSMYVLEWYLDPLDELQGSGHRSSEILQQPGPSRTLVSFLRGRLMCHIGAGATSVWAARTHTRCVFAEIGQLQTQRMHLVV